MLPRGRIYGTKRRGHAPSLRELLEGWADGEGAVVDYVYNNIYYVTSYIHICILITGGK